MGGEFVVNLVDEGIVERVDLCAIDFPHGTSEADEVGLALAACAGTDVPRIAESPASLACREHATHVVGGNRVVIGTVHAMSVRDGIVDPESLRVDHDALKMIGRMGPPDRYTRTTDSFGLKRPSLDEWRAGKSRG